MPATTNQNPPAIAATAATAATGSRLEGRCNHMPPQLDFKPSLRPAGSPATATTVLSVAMAAVLLLVACGPTLRDNGTLQGRAALQAAPAASPLPVQSMAVSAQAVDPARTVALSPAPTPTPVADRRDPALHHRHGGEALPPAGQRPRVDNAAPAPQLGNITAIDPIRSDPKPSSGAGLVIGGVLGGLLGNQMGGGDGRKAATALGAVGGAIAGNNVERLRSRDVVGYRVQLQLDNGQQRSVTLRQRGDFGTGDRVRLVGGKLQRA